MGFADYIKNVFGIDMACQCLGCQETRQYQKSIDSCPIQIHFMNSQFHSRILRVGRKHGMKNEDLQEPRIRVMDKRTGDIKIVRAPYGLVD